MGPVPHDCSASSFGEAVGALLRARYPTHTAKFIARDLSRVGMGECTTKTAENILGGALSAKSITRLTLAYGLGLLIDAGGRVTGKTLDDFIEEQADRARNEQGRWDRLQAVLADGRAARAVERAGVVGRPPELGRVPDRRDARRAG